MKSVHAKLSIAFFIITVVFVMVIHANENKKYKEIEKNINKLLDVRVTLNNN